MTQLLLVFLKPPLSDINVSQTTWPSVNKIFEKIEMSEMEQKFPGNTSDSSDLASSPSTGRSKTKHSQQTQKND